MLQEMKKNLHEWQKLLQLTGGDLSLDKCKITIMHWYQEGEWGQLKLTTKKQQSGTIRTKSIKDTYRVQELERLEPHEAERVLGIRLPLTGDMKIEYKYRKKQLQLFCHDLYKAPLTHYEAHVAYQTRFQPIATYPYPVTQFTTQELHTIQKGCMKLILPKLGINRNMPRDVIYGPQSLGGRQLTNLTLKQPTLHLRTTLGHLRRKDKLSSMLYATMRDLQLELGVTKPFYTLPPDRYEYVTDNTRWRYTWKTANEFGITLHITNFWVPRTMYNNDECIMEKAINDPSYYGRNRYKLQTINKCRLYQECIFISDIMAENGLRIQKEYLDGSKKNKNKTILFPASRKPTTLEWNEWKSFVFRNFLSGQYYITPTPSYNEQNNTLMIPTTEMDIVQQMNCTNMRFEKAIDALPKPLRVILGIINVPLDNGLELIDAMNKGTLLGASDGSVTRKQKKKTGGHAYSLRQWNTDKYLLTGYAITPYSTTMNSLTTELYGLLATTIALLALTKVHHAKIEHTASAVLTSDNEQAVAMATTFQPALNISETLQSDYDLQALIHNIQSEIPIKIYYKWVRGHQDRNDKGAIIYGPHLREVQANIEMDKLAARGSVQTQKQSSKRHTYSTTVMGMYNSEGEYIGDLNQHLLHSTMEKPLWNYLKRKHNWTEEDMETICWEGIENAVKSYKPYLQTKIMQLMHHWQYIGERKLLMKETTGQCPMQCGMLETKLHYVYCKDASINEKKNIQNTSNKTNEGTENISRYNCCNKHDTYQGIHMGPASRILTKQLH